MTKEIRVKVIGAGVVLLGQALGISP